MNLQETNWKQICAIVLILLICGSLIREVSDAARIGPEIEPQTYEATLTRVAPLSYVTNAAAHSVSWNSSGWIWE